VPTNHPAATFNSAALRALQMLLGHGFAKAASLLWEFSKLDSCAASLRRSRVNRFRRDKRRRGNLLLQRLPGRAAREETRHGQVKEGDQPTAVPAQRHYSPKGTSLFFSRYLIIALPATMMPL